jgi:mRNA interferase HigB
MKVIGEDSLMEFAEKHPNARSALVRWLSFTRIEVWKDFAAVKRTFPTTDYITNGLCCFDIGGNNYRLIALISFQLNTVTILNLMTHAQYNKWNKRKNRKQRWTRNIYN